MRALIIVLSLAGVFGCPDAAEYGSECDADGDGHESPRCGGHDCDDGDPGAYPNAPEVCDGIDNNCNGRTAIRGTSDTNAAQVLTDYDDSEADTDGDGIIDCADCAPGPGGGDECR
jgi:hypothetical protein